MGKIQINHIQCETFPLHEGSLRGLCKRVYYTPKSIDRCPFCRNALTTRYVYMVPISETECVKVNGKACFNCDAFFSMCRALLEGLNRRRVKKDQYQYGVLHLDQISECLAMPSFSVPSVETRMLLRRRLTDYYGDRAIHDWTPSDKADEDNPSVQTDGEVIPEINSDMTLYVYFGNISCLNKHHLFEYKARIPTLDGDKGFWVQYCLECRQYYMKYSDYKVYLDRFGFFPMRAEPIGIPIDYDGLAEYSPLRLNGYTTVGTTREKRQKCLAHILDYCIMEKRKVADYLEQFIRRGENNPSHMFAVPKWKEDLDFVLDYRLKEKPEVFFGTIERRRS